MLCCEQFEELSESLTEVVFVKVDVDENPDSKWFTDITCVPFFVAICSLNSIRLSSAAAKYNVSAMPTFLFIKGGEVVDRLMGANPERLQELIHEHK
jgi:thioredoxin 1